MAARHTVEAGADGARSPRPAGRSEQPRFPPIRRQVVRATATLIRREKLISAGDLLVVAVSGGQDSVCLLDVLRGLGSRLGARLHVAHVDHRLRGAQSALDAAHVAELAAGYGLPCTLLSADVAGYRRAHRFSTQVAARYARYQLLGRLASELGAAAVALGHTNDDLVETLLLNLVRGAGLRGLAGMRPDQEIPLRLFGPPLPGVEAPASNSALRLLRPLLAVERHQTAEYCRAAGLAIREDPSNASRDYRRNRVRAELLPALERFNPSIRRALTTTAQLLRDDLAVVESVVSDAWARLARRGESEVAFERPGFVAESPAIQRRLLRRAVEAIEGSSNGLRATAVDGAVRLAVRAEPGRRSTLTSRAELATDYHGFVIRLRQADEEHAEARARLLLPGVQLTVPGRASLGTLGELDAQLIDEPAAVARARLQASTLPPDHAVLDADKLGPRLLLRGRRPGDRMQPLGMRGTRKLHDLLVDAKVPRDARDAIPVVESSRGIAWLVGLRVDERFRIDETTRRLALLRYLPQRQQ